MKKKKAYIAGKVGGLEYGEAKENFDRLAKILRERDLEVFSPTEMIPENMPWHEAMRHCIATMVFCDEVYFLHNWRDSRGATIEHEICIALGLARYYLPEMQKVNN